MEWASAANSVECGKENRLRLEPPSENMILYAIIFVKICVTSRIFVFLHFLPPLVARRTGDAPERIDHTNHERFFGYLFSQ